MPKARRLPPPVPDLGPGSPIPSKDPFVIGSPAIRRATTSSRVPGQWSSASRALTLESDQPIATVNSSQAGRRPAHGVANPDLRGSTTAATSGTPASVRQSQGAAAAQLPPWAPAGAAGAPTTPLGPPPRTARSSATFGSATARTSGTYGVTNTRSSAAFGTAAIRNSGSFGSGAMRTSASFGPSLAATGVRSGVRSSSSTGARPSPTQPYIPGPSPSSTKALVAGSSAAASAAHASRALPAYTAGMSPVGASLSGLAHQGFTARASYGVPGGSPQVTDTPHSAAPTISSLLRSSSSGGAGAVGRHRRSSSSGSGAFEGAHGLAHRSVGGAGSCAACCRLHALGGITGSSTSCGGNGVAGAGGGGVAGPGKHQASAQQPPWRHAGSTSSGGGSSSSRHSGCWGSAGSSSAGGAPSSSSSLVSAATTGTITASGPQGTGGQATRLGGTSRSGRAVPLQRSVGGGVGAMGHIAAECSFAEMLEEEWQGTEGQQVAGGALRADRQGWGPVHRAGASHTVKEELGVGEGTWPDDAVPPVQEVLASRCTVNAHTPAEQHSGAAGARCAAALQLPSSPSSVAPSPLPPVHQPSPSISANDAAAAATPAAIAADAPAGGIGASAQQHMGRTSVGGSVGLPKATTPPSVLPPGMVPSPKGASTALEVLRQILQDATLSHTPGSTPGAGQGVMRSAGSMHCHADTQFQPLHTPASAPGLTAQCGSWAGGSPLPAGHTSHTVHTLHQLDQAAGSQSVGGVAAGGSWLSTAALPSASFSTPVPQNASHPAVHNLVWRLHAELLPLLSRDAAAYEDRRWEIQLLHQVSGGGASWAYHTGRWVVGSS